MCGIVGYYNFGNTHLTTASTSILEKAQATMAHRGPDGYRIWQSDDKKIGIAHRRLSIVDLSDAGYQPMFDDEQTIAICCNGEIYNHKVLRLELEAHGFRFKSQSDTEVIVYAYKKWGIECLQKLEGMFSIVIIDLKHNKLFLVRDRMGVKPLYFSLQNNILSFASEIKALWELPWVQRAVNSLGVYHYLTFLATPAPLTIYKGIYKLPAGYYAQVARGAVSFDQWYNPLITFDRPHPKELKHEASYVKELRVLLRKSVQKRLMSDVPLGAFLSGGIDSSLIVAYMSEFTSNLKTFNVSFADGQEFSELIWARKVARKFNTDHHEIIISEKEAFDFFEKMVHHQDEPLADCVCVPLYYVSKLAKDSGVTVVLSGEGSDELFCGYSLYAQYVNLYHRFWQHTQRYIPAFTKKGVFNVASRLFSNRLTRLEILKNWAENKALFWGGALSFHELIKRDFIQDLKHEFDPVIDQIYPGLAQSMDSHNIVHYHLEEIKQKYPQADFLSTMIYLELKQRLSELLLMRLDKMTMATSVEGRVPFLDHTFVEFALRIPSTLKFKNNVTKYIVKKAAETLLPHEIIYRKKVGFAAPTLRWFKEGSYFKPYFRDLITTHKSDWQDFINVDEAMKLFDKNQSADTEYSTQLWTLQNLLAFKIQ